MDSWNLCITDRIGFLIIEISKILMDRQWIHDLVFELFWKDFSVEYRRDNNSNWYISFIWKSARIYKWPRWLDSDLDLTWGKLWDSSRNDYENISFYAIRHMVWVKGLLGDLVIEGLINREGVLNLAKFWNLSTSVKWICNRC